eukprot:2510600-Rhodomonas_salina.1
MYVLPVPLLVAGEVLHVDVVPVVVPAVLARERSAALEVDPHVLTVGVHAGDNHQKKPHPYLG